MKKVKKETKEETKQTRKESERLKKWKKTQKNKYLGILKADSIKQEKMKEKSTSRSQAL